MPGSPGHSYGGRTAKRLALEESLTWRVGGTGSGTRLQLPYPILEAGYQLRAGAASVAFPTLLTEQEYVRSLRRATVPLDSRAEQCIVEALRAWTLELPLACVSMLGAVAENVWLSLARNAAAPGITKALDRRNMSIASVQDEVIKHLRQSGTVSKYLPDALDTHARHLRELRNYGIHGDEDDHMDHQLRSDALAGLFLSTHRHLIELATAMRASTTTDRDREDGCP